MRTWALLLAGLVIWTVHFFALYIVGSIWLTTPLARALTLALTLLCTGAVAMFLVRARRYLPETAMDRWVRSISLVGLGVSAVAILWQGLPALLI